MLRRFLLLAVCAASTQAAGGMLDIDCRRLVSRADLVDDTPVSRSEEGMPVGNGRMGNLVRTASHTARSKLETRDHRILLTQEFAEGDFFCGSVVAVGMVGRDAEVRPANPGECRLVIQPGLGTFTVLMASAASFDRKPGVASSFPRAQRRSSSNAPCPHRTTGENARTQVNQPTHETSVD